jgi:hypothetical protein
LERRYECITIHNSGKLISEPNHVAKLFHTYFTEIAQWLQCNFIPGIHKYNNGHQRFSASIFFKPTNTDEIMTIIKDLKKPKSKWIK